MSANFWKPRRSSTCFWKPMWTSELPRRHQGANRCSGRVAGHTRSKQAGGRAVSKTRSVAIGWELCDRPFVSPSLETSRYRRVVQRAHPQTSVLTVVAFSSPRSHAEDDAHRVSVPCLRHQAARRPSHFAALRALGFRLMSS